MTFPVLMNCFQVSSPMKIPPYRLIAFLIRISMKPLPIPAKNYQLHFVLSVTEVFHQKIAVPPVFFYLDPELEIDLGI